jgi:S-formylglutathione hydrolase FrmB
MEMESVMFGSLSLVHGVLPVLIVVLAIGSLLLLLGRRDGVWKRQLLIGVPVTVALLAAVIALIEGLHLIEFGFPFSFYLWFSSVLFAIVLTAIGWRRLGLAQRLTGGVALVLTVLMTLTFINANYQYYPTVRSLFGTNAHHISPGALPKTPDSGNTPPSDGTARAALEQERIQATGGDPSAATKGTLVQMAIPGKTSGFTGREAYIWLPPVWFTDPTRKLPVVELLPGVPGGPSDWTRAGFADQTASQFAQAHDGLAPIIVMPDSNGSEVNDTECVNGPLGNAETYLTVDVPAFVRTTFDASTAHGSLAVAGLSAGGMCATMLALRNPGIYSTFADYAGLTSPTVGESVDPDATTRQLFGGSTAAYLAHDPLHLLAANSYPGLAAWFEVGTYDGGPLAAERKLVPLARAAGIGTYAVEVPGAGHNFDLFAKAFADSLPFLSYRLGLTPAPAGLANAANAA